MQLGFWRALLRGNSRYEFSSSSGPLWLLKILINLFAIEIVENIEFFAFLKFIDSSSILNSHR